MLVDQCMNGVYDLDFASPVYRNLACARCNAASNVTCLTDKNIRMAIPHQCMPETAAKLAIDLLALLPGEPTQQPLHLAQNFLVKFVLVKFLRSN